MERKNLICINCPLGCELTVRLDRQNVISVAGNSCPRGEAYARAECTHPTRILTTLVPVNGGTFPVVSVKTTAPIPKEKIGDCVRALKQIRLQAPVQIGDAVCPDIAGTGISAVATRSVGGVSDGKTGTSQTENGESISHE